MRSILSQCFNIPPPTLTERNLPDQIGNFRPYGPLLVNDIDLPSAGRVHIVTEGYTGCGLELAKILYQRNGTVYIAGRSKDKADKAIKLMRTAHPHSKGKAEFLYLDLADMRSIKPAVERFLSLEKRLDTLTNNAGIMAPPFGSKTAQDFELQLGTNVLGPWAFSHMLTPLLKETAAVTAPGTVRITWASSIAVDLLSPKPGGVIFDLATGHPVTFKSQDVNYGQSKAANTLIAAEFARRHPFSESKIISVSWNPGNLRYIAYTPTT
jgi:NAD(P)-dependent dehydrogenase (short-subunit alcohol dehydrogenase family)